MKRMATLTPELTCPYCREVQYQTQNSKTKAAFLNLLVSLPLLFQIFFDVPEAVLLTIIPVLAVIVILIYPFLVKLSCKEEYINFFKD